MLFQRQIQRLERKLARLESLSRRYSLARLVIFLAGGAAALGAAFFSGPPAGWSVFSLAALLFCGVVLLHRRLESWAASFRVWLALYREKAARLALDWEHIPLPVSSGETPTPLALDLDLSGPRSLHHLLDASLSRQGSRRLAAWLTTSVPDLPGIAQRQAVVHELAGLDRFRNRLALLYRRLGRGPMDADVLLGWLQVPYPARRLFRVLPWITLLVLANDALFVLGVLGRLPPVWGVTTLAYVGVYLACQKMNAEFLEALFHLDRELAAFRPLLRFVEQFPYPAGSALRSQCAAFLDGSTRPSRSLCRLQTVTALAGLRMNPALGLLLNLALPWDFWVAWLSARQREAMRSVLPAWLEAFHQLDALVSLGEFAALHPEYTFPTWAAPGEPAAPVFTATALGHPLLPPDRKVRNDLQIDALGALLIITGSNMAGKSTFIRTVGINLCLAYAGAPVDAASLRTLPFRLYTCIRISDSLGDGFSYFYAEVKRLKGLLDALLPDPSGLPLLYLVDEIFRGTNNRERLAGSRAYVKALFGAAGIGLIATHDLELAALADLHPLARNVHFRDDVSGGKLTFDYILRPGPSPTTNALRIMADEGLPVE